MNYRRANLIERSRREIRVSLRAFHEAADRGAKAEAIDRAHEVQVWSAALAEWMRNSKVAIRNRRT